MKRVLVVLAILLLVAVPGVSAGPKTKSLGTVSGVVLGPDDRPVPRASITYQSSAGNDAHVVRADSQGRFTITKLRSDNYDLRASGKGVFSEWEKNVNVKAGQTKTLTLRLIYAKEIPKAYVNTKPKQ